MRRDGRMALQFVATLLLIVGTGVVAFSAPEFWRQYTLLKTWNRVEATVVRSRVVPLPTATGGYVYDAEYTFAFRLADDVHVASIGSNHQSSSEERKRKQVARFPEGSRHAILYNPADPADIRMQPGYNVHFFAIPIFISGVGLIFVMGGALLWRLGRRRPPRPE